MKMYRVVIDGSNFMIKEGDEARQMGFIAERFVEALSEGVAEQKAMAMINADQNFMIRVCNDANNPPFMMARESEELDSFPTESQVSGGYDLYDENAVKEEMERKPRGFFQRLFGKSS